LKDKWLQATIIATFVFIAFNLWVVMLNIFLLRNYWIQDASEINQSLASTIFSHLFFYGFAFGNFFAVHPSFFFFSIIPFFSILPNFIAGYAIQYAIVFSASVPLYLIARKISQTVARIAAGSTEQLNLGNLGARKDWGYAKDYVEGIWMMLQHNKPDDFVLGTGELHTVREFGTEAFSVAGVGVHWEGKGVDERGVDDEGNIVVTVDVKLFRPLEADNFLADYSKAEKLLGWRPRTKFKELVKIMVENDMSRRKA